MSIVQNVERSTRTIFSMEFAMMRLHLCVFFVGCSSLHKESELNSVVYESTQGASHILQVGDSTAKSYILNSDKQDLIIIDTGGEDNNPVLAQLAAEGKSPDDVRKIFLTHAHGNHIGGLHLFSNAEIYALETERDALLEKGIVLDVGLEDNQILSIGSSELEVFAVPGHSIGNATYRFDDLLIMGDSALSKSDVSIEPITSNADDPHMAHESLLLLAQELEYRQEEIAYMLFSHSDTLVGLDALFDYE